MRRLITTAKAAAATAENIGQRLLAAVGLRQSDRRIAQDSQEYWSDPASKRWDGNSHVRGAGPLSDDVWNRIGERHAEMFERALRASGTSRPMNRVVDYGCGGGMNAVALAPLCGEVIGVDVNAAVLAKAEREVSQALGDDHPFTTVQVDVSTPETAVQDVGAGTVDAWVSFYVFELVPTPEYGERLLRIAETMLAPGGVALIQIKYTNGGLLTRPRRRGYHRGLAAMTTYRIPEFWELATRAGLKPIHVELVVKDDLDERYAYFTLVKPPA